MMRRADAILLHDASMELVNNDTSVYDEIHSEAYRIDDRTLLWIRNLLADQFGIKTEPANLDLGFYREYSWFLAGQHVQIQDLYAEVKGPGLLDMKVFLRDLKEGSSWEEYITYSGSFSVRWSNND